MSNTVYILWTHRAGKRKMMNHEVAPVSGKMNERTVQKEDKDSAPCMLTVLRTENQFSVYYWMDECTIG